MLSKSEVTILNHYYIALQHSKWAKGKEQEQECIKMAINTFFEEKPLKNCYSHKIEEIKKTSASEESYQVTISIDKSNIGLIGTVTLQFSKNSVSIVTGDSNLVVLTIMDEVNYNGAQKLASNNNFLAFGHNLEMFKQEWNRCIKKPYPTESPFNMSFFGTITTTTSPPDLHDLTFFVVEALKCHRPGLSDSVEWHGRAEIIKILSNYISGDIDQKQIDQMRGYARDLKGADSNTFRKLSVATMASSLTVFAVAVTFVVLAIMSILGGPVTATTCGFVMGLAMTAFIGGVVHFEPSGERGTKRPDFASRAVLFLADKITESLGPDDHPAARQISIQPPVENPSLSGLLLQTGGNPAPDFAKLLVTFEPVLKGIYGDDIDQQVHNDLMTGLTLQVNKGLTIDGLKNSIESTAKILDKNDRLTALYTICDVTKPSTLNPL